MDTRTLTALRRSIKKWEDVAAGTGTDRGSTNCALCQEFLVPRNGDHTCSGCPVMVRTGVGYCEATPYIEWARGTRAGVDGRRAVDDEQRALARAELDFLRSLLPEGAR